MSRIGLMLALLSAAGCRTGLDDLSYNPGPTPAGDMASAAPTDLTLAPPVDLARPVENFDFTLPRPPDLALPPDLAVRPADLAVPPDFFLPPILDLAQRPPDLLVLPDLTPAPDLTPPPDLAVRPPDLVIAADMASVYPAPHPPMPQVINAGGPRLINPRMYSVTFNGDAAAAQLDAYVAALPASAWWTAVMSDYGVGAGSAAAPIHLAEAAPNRIDDAQVQTWLAGKLDGTHPEFGKPDNNSLYILEYPMTSTVTLQGAASCQQFGGYHSSLVLGNGQYVAYAVIGRCRADALNPGLAIIDVTTVTISHEVVEAATDATPLMKPAYSTVDVPSQGWEMAAGAETADLCVLLPGDVIFPRDLPGATQRSWSNLAARADKDPCVPATPGVTYFNSAPILVDKISNPYEGTITNGIKAAVGQSKTIEVDLYSNGPTAAWTVSAVDILSLGGGQPYLTFSWNKNTGVNGDKLMLTVTVTRAGPNGFEPFLIRSTLNGYTTQWQVAVSPR